MDERNRRLKKYEAEARADRSVAGARGEAALELFSPFGPIIGRLRADPDLVEALNRYADPSVSVERSREFLVAPEVLARGGERSIAAQTSRLVRRYLAVLNEPADERIDFENFWVVSQRAGTPSPVHFHSGDVSGVLYLKVPEVEPGEEQSNYIAGRNAGYINFLIGGKQRLSRSLVSFKPEVGDFYVFPGWLLHGVEPFRGSGERRSMAFNAFLRPAAA